MKKNELTLKSALASVAGMGMGVYAGSNLLVRGVAAAGVWYLGRSFKPKEPLFLSTLALLAGHWVWLLVGTAILGVWQHKWIDIAVMLALIGWLWLRPSLSAAISLTVLEVVAVLLNALAFSNQAAGSLAHKALFLHIALRCLAVFFAWQAYLAWRRGSDV